MKRLPVVIALTMIVATFGSGIAAADPLNSPQHEILTVTCDGQTYQVLDGPGQSPAHILDTNGQLHPLAYHYTAKDPDTGEILFSGTNPVGQGNKQGLQDELMTCTSGPFTVFVRELGQKVDFFFEIPAFLTPRGR